MIVEEKKRPAFNVNLFKKQKNKKQNLLAKQATIENNPRSPPGGQRNLFNKPKNSSKAATQADNG